jgi:hypothetical protein
VATCLLDTWLNTDMAPDHVAHLSRLGKKATRHNGDVATWHNGDVATWHNGDMATSRNANFETFRNVVNCMWQKPIFFVMVLKEWMMIRTRVLMCKPFH